MKRRSCGIVLYASKFFFYFSFHIFTDNFTERTKLSKSRFIKPLLLQVLCVVIYSRTMQKSGFGDVVRKILSQGVRRGKKL
jgi:hypothetical protein